ncbi:hypothetical protein BSIN_4643 [Burkholderia singularis]|uniref:Uncharacterized protein n=1 Tax=Burkholderia singularis TaxID=1503053 RepID=A0A238H8R5_9BURK|nr:hypothetical protein BSIN_4643 [Burkholderia singularis]
MMRVSPQCPPRLPGGAMLHCITPPGRTHDSRSNLPVTYATRASATLYAGLHTFHNAS